PGEDLCYLAGDWRILQRLDGHRWSLDDLVTAWFAARLLEGAPARTVLDLGCGIGAVLMLLAWRFPAARALGIEAQELSVALARRSLVWNGAAGRCRVVLGDLRDPSLLPPASFDLVAGTPPYLRPGSATPPSRVQCGPCHLELRGGIEDYCVAAVRWMGPGGRFVVCQAAAHVERVLAAAAAAGLGVDAHPRPGRDVGDRVRAGEELVLRKASVEHAVETPGLALIALDRVVDLLGSIAEEDVRLTLHRADAAHLEHEPLDRDRAGPGV